MSFAKIYQATVAGPATLLNPLQSVLALIARLWVGWQFLKAGYLKFSSWSTTVFLFEEEYQVPLLSPQLAAILGTAGELVFPILLFLGLAGRLSALGLSAVNILAVVSYAHVLFQSGFEAAVGQHYLWGFMLLTLVVYGPGKLSVDHLLSRSVSHRREPAPAALAAPV